MTDNRDSRKRRARNCKRKKSMKESGGLFSSDDESDPDGSKLPKSKFFSGLFPKDPDFEVTGKGKVQKAKGIRGRM